MDQQHFQGKDFIPLHQPHAPAQINGQEFYLIPKGVWERLVESYYRTKLIETDSDSEEEAEQSPKKKKQKETPSRKELVVEGTSFSLILFGPSNFHTTQDICFIDRSNQCNVNFKLLRGYLNDQEKEISKTEYGTALKISSSKTFASKARGIYKLIFELELLFGYYVELSIETSWQGYSNNNSFRSLDITECKVQLIEQ